MFEVKEYIIQASLPFLRPNNTHYFIRYYNFISKYGYTTDVGEVHHALPRALFPTYEHDNNNLVLLPRKAHFIAHMILAKLYDCYEMWNALKLMSNTSMSDLKISSKLYDEVKKKQAEGASVSMREYQLDKVKNGTHPWVGENNWVHEAIKNGTFRCNFGYGDDHYIHETIRNGTYKSNFGYDEDHHSHEKIRNGTHHWQDYDNHPAVIRIKNGTHHFITNNPAKRKPWKHPKVTLLSSITWWFADEAYKIFLLSPSTTCNILCSECNKVLEIESLLGVMLSVTPVRSMIDYFSNRNWIPLEDPEWIEFKNSFKIY